VRRRIALSHFGRCFCEICVPLEEPRQRSARRTRSGEKPKQPKRSRR
jgi:hypothetical protein